MIYKYKKFLENQNITTDIIKIVDKIGFTVDSSDIIKINGGYIVEVDKFKVIKLSRKDMISYKKLVNKNIDGLVKVYSVGKIDGYNYAILENLNPLSNKNLMIYENMTKLVVELLVELGEAYSSFESQIANLADTDADIEVINKALLDNNKIDEYNLFNRIIKIFKFLNAEKIKNVDIGSHNLMQNKKGDILMVDISDEYDI